MKEICRQHGFTEQTFYRWKKQYAGLGITELRELRELRDENRRLKRIVAEWLQAAYQVSERRSCKVIPI